MRKKNKYAIYIKKYIYNHLFSSALYIIVRLGLKKKVGRKKKLNPVQK
jgi:hypothetical protein